MDCSQFQRYSKYFESTLSYQDMLVCFECDSKTLQNRIKKRGYKYPSSKKFTQHQQIRLVWSQLSPQKPYYAKACEFASKLYYKKILILYDSSVDQKFFAALGNAGINLRAIAFWNCRMRDGLHQKLSMIQLKHLQQLSIFCDPFGNRGLKNLVKLSMPSLQIVSILNTNVTADGIKALRRLCQSRIDYIQVDSQKGNLLPSSLKTVFNFQKVVREFTLFIHLQSSKDFCFYYGHFAKVRSFNCSVLAIASQKKLKNMEQAKKLLMMSDEVWSKLNNRLLKCKLDNI